MASEPPSTSDPPRSYGSGPWPAGFRGIGGHLIHPPAATASPSLPAELSPTDGIASHGAHLLSPISLGEEGARSALCPVCRTVETLPPEGGWLPLRCRTCGTEFVATDGSPPPEPVPEPPKPPVPSPIAPPSVLGPLPSLGFPRSFTSDVRTDVHGRMWATCPWCRGAEVLFPPGAVTLRCPACLNTFLVGLRPESPEPEPEPEPSSPSPAKVFNPDGRLWDHCPNCGYEALTPDRIGSAFVLTCAVCGQQVVVSEGPHPPRPAPLPAPPSVWERIRRLFRRR